MTQIHAPRGTGKSLFVLARMVALARRGLRVLYCDRDNSPATLRKRLAGLGAHDVPQLKVLTREQAPPLWDKEAWAAFPLASYDVVVLDAWDSCAEGAGEQDSRRTTLALASLLDLVRRHQAPGVIVLGNVTKDGRAGRGAGPLEDRADIVYEARDVTGFTPSGRTPWWEELPPAARGEWAGRATRRTNRPRAERIRLGFISTKSRDEEDPTPFVLEVDFATEPWAIHDVTAELLAAGDAARAAELAKAEQTREQAAEVLAAELGRRIAGGSRPLITSAAEALLREHGLKRQPARDLLKSGGGGRWRMEPLDGRRIAVVPTGESVVSCPLTAQSKPPEGPHEQRGFAEADSADRMDRARRDAEAGSTARNAAILSPRIALSSPVIQPPTDAEVNPWTDS